MNQLIEYHGLFSLEQSQKGFSLKDVKIRLPLPILLCFF